MWLRMLACVLVTMVVGTAGQEGPVVSVTRGGVEDVFTISSPDGAYNRSCADYKTYMVEEDVCREDTDLQSKELEMVITASSIILFFIFI